MFAREPRRLGLRPRCEGCRSGGYGATVELVHEAGEELQIDGESYRMRGDRAPCNSSERHLDSRH
jgi:hypothetical protein